MKKLLCALAVASFALTVAAPAEARTIKKRTYTVKITKAPVPCSVVCAYWLDGLNNRDAGIKFQACRAPFPTGSYTDIVLRAPRGANNLKVVAYPLLDWDTFLCSKPARGNNGRQLAQGANSATDTHGCSFGAALGCKETMGIPVKAGKKYVLRSYNWSDAADMKVRVIWRKL